MRKGIDGLAMLVQGVLRQDPSRAPVRIPRPQGQSHQDRHWDGTAFALHQAARARRILVASNVEPGGTLMLTSAQLSMLIDGVDWRAPERQWRPAVAG
jgi:transposase